MKIVQVVFEKIALLFLWTPCKEPPIFAAKMFVFTGYPPKMDKLLKAECE
jgi:hypothetical protein